MNVAAKTYGVWPGPHGSLRLELAGDAAYFRASGALWLEETRLLAVADMHLEKGSAYAARGQLLPPYDTSETLMRLEAEVEALSPAILVLMGDSLHDRLALERIDADCRERLARLAAGRTLVWIAGNHDAEGLDGLDGDVVCELNVGDILLRHQPAPGPQRGEAAGHLHPSARVAAQGRSVRRRCFVTDGERVVLPAFGAYAGGLNVRDAAFRGLFVRPPLAVVISADRAHPVAWGSLRGD